MIVHKAHFFSTSAAEFEPRQYSWVSETIFNERGDPEKYQSGPLNKNHLLALAEYPQGKKQHLTTGEKRKLYKLTIMNGKRSMLGSCAWIPLMECFLLFARRPQASTRSAWTTKGVGDRNRATEHLRQHANSKWHRDAAASAAMAKQADPRKFYPTKNTRYTVQYWICSVQVPH